MENSKFENPYRPGAGFKPPFLAGREEEKKQFLRLLQQSVVLKNLIITGLRGTGKTVLLETLKPMAFENGWLWIGSDLSESASVTETTFATRLLTDLSVITSSLVIGQEESVGFKTEAGEQGKKMTMSYERLINYFNSQPGLVADKLKATLEMVHKLLGNVKGLKGVVFAYDEAQNMTDHAKQEQYPLSLLLDVFQSLQRKEVQFMLVLTGLPTLFSKLVEARTYSERMFEIISLENLVEEESREAILKPLDETGCPVRFDDESVGKIVKESGGYPYFIQFICRETYDVFLSQFSQGVSSPSVPISEITAKLDTEFFSARWQRATDKQRELLRVIASLEDSDNEFSAQEILESTKGDEQKNLSPSGVNQMLAALTDLGLVHKTRHGKYAFAVPLLGHFIRRQK